MTVSVSCPIECLADQNPPDFLEKHHGFVFSMVGMLGTGAGVLLAYLLRSRCTYIKCFGCTCRRRPVILGETALSNIVI